MRVRQLSWTIGLLVMLTDLQVFAAESNVPRYSWKAGYLHWVWGGPADPDVIGYRVSCGATMGGPYPISKVFALADMLPDPGFAGKIMLSGLLPKPTGPTSTRWYCVVYPKYADGDGPPSDECGPFVFGSGHLKLLVGP